MCKAINPPRICAVHTPLGSRECTNTFNASHGPTRPHSRLDPVFQSVHASRSCLEAHLLSLEKRQASEYGQDKVSDPCSSVFYAINLRMLVSLIRLGKEPERPTILDPELRVPPLSNLHTECISEDTVQTEYRGCNTEYNKPKTLPKATRYPRFQPCWF